MYDFLLFLIRQILTAFVTEILTLHGNNLTGTMPQSICDLRTNHKLRVLMADCDVSDGKPPKVECDCCTHCNPYRK